jgi:microcystin-dependent protein
LGEVDGTETVVLIQTQLPSHVHNVVSATVTPAANTTAGGSNNGPQGGYFSSASSDLYASGHNNAGGPTPFTLTLSVAGGGAPHENMMPYLAMNYIIAVEGIFPSRN